MINNFFDGIDAIYWINLDRSVDRYKHMKSLLTDPVFNKIPNIRFSAIDGKNPKYKEMFNYDDMLYPWISDGEYACLISHLEVLKLISKSKYDICLVLEDDVTLDFQKYWKNEDKIMNIIKDAPSDWDIIQLCYVYNFVTPLPGNKFENRKTCATAYIVKKQSAAKLINSIYHDNKYSLNPVIYPVSDIYIFKQLNTYIYQKPLLTYRSDNDSTIHESHLDYHEMSKQMVMKYIHKDKSMVVDYRYELIRYCIIFIICLSVYVFRDKVDKYIRSIMCIIIFVFMIATITR